MTMVSVGHDGPEFEGVEGGLKIAAALFHGLSDPSRLAILEHPSTNTATKPFTPSPKPRHDHPPRNHPGNRELVSTRTPLTKPGPVYPATIQYKRSDKGMQVPSEDATASPGTRSEGHG